MGCLEGGSLFAAEVSTFSILNKTGALTSRGRVLSAFTAASITGNLIADYSIFDNSVGFNRFLLGN